MLSNNIKLVTAPVLRYFKSPCCSDLEHASNRGEDNFRNGILGGLERLRKSTRDFLFNSGIRNLKVISPLWLMVRPKATYKDLQEKIKDLWAGDPVHPTPEGYNTLLAAIRKTARGDPEAEAWHSPTQNQDSQGSISNGLEGDPSRPEGRHSAPGGGLSGATGGAAAAYWKVPRTPPGPAAKIPPILAV